MKSITISSIIPGTVAEADYCTADGKVLISNGIIITQDHIDILRRRNIKELFIREKEDSDEIKKLLSTEFHTLGELSFIKETRHDLKPPALEPLRPNIPKALELPEFKTIQTGLEGLDQLNKSWRAEELDKKFKSGRTPDRPMGPALKDNAKELSPRERTDTYKNHMTLLYENALIDIKTILNSLANGDKVSASFIRKIIEQFVKIFVTDKNILLYLSTTRCKEEMYLYNHSLNVCLLAINIAASNGYNREQVIEIGMGAILFDVGMLLIPRDIYLKKGRLTRDEWYEIQKHPILGLHLLENITGLPESVPYIAYQVHERENATGYPKKRDKRLTHCFSKIVQIADVYIALSSPRPYREEYIPYTAMEMIIKMMRTGLISGEFVKSLLCYTSLFPVGSLVELSNKKKGKVIKASETSFTKPVVTVLTNEFGELLQPKKYFQIDLSEETGLQIVKALKADYLPEINSMDGF